MKIHDYIKFDKLMEGQSICRKLCHCKSLQESLENQLQMQRHHLEAKLQKQDGHLESKLKEQSEKLEAKLSKRSEHQSQHLETQLKEQIEQFQEAVRQLSECHKVYIVYCTLTRQMHDIVGQAWVTAHEQHGAVACTWLSSIVHDWT